MRRIVGVILSASDVGIAATDATALNSKLLLADAGRPLFDAIVPCSVREGLLVRLLGTGRRIRMEPELHGLVDEGPRTQSPEFAGLRH